MTLKDTIHELFAEHGRFEFDELGFKDQSLLAEAYILENEDVIFDLFANVHTASMGLHFSQLYHSVARVNAFEMVEDIRLAMVRSDDIEILIDGEVCRYWPSWEAERAECGREASHDSLNDTLERLASLPMAQKQAD